MEAIVFDIINTYNISGYNIKRFINVINSNKNYVICVNDSVIVDGGTYVSIVFIAIKGKEYHFGFKAEWDEKIAKYYIYTDNVYLYNKAHDISNDIAHHRYAFIDTEFTIEEIAIKMISSVVTRISNLEEIAHIKKIIK